MKDNISLILPIGFIKSTPEHGGCGNVHISFGRDIPHTLLSIETSLYLQHHVNALLQLYPDRPFLNKSGLR
jgi:hypothetical protein